MEARIADDMRLARHGMWGAVAGSWADHASLIDERQAATTERLLALTAPRPGERVLELACGPGGAGLAAAPLVAPGGEVVLSDVAAEMTAIAGARAAERGLAGIVTRQLELEAIDEPDDAYDVVLCREGLMLVDDPRRAAGEIARVLRPGGRAAVSVWAGRERNPWLGVLFDAVGDQLGAEVPPPGVPGPFSLPDGDGLARLLSGAGLGSAAVEEVAVPFRAASLDGWWSVVPRLAGPLAQMLAALPGEALAAIYAHAAERLRPYETAAGLEIPGVALVASGNRV